MPRKRSDGCSCTPIPTSPPTVSQPLMNGILRYHRSTYHVYLITSLPNSPTGNYQDSLSDARSTFELQPFFKKAIVTGKILFTNYVSFDGGVALSQKLLSCSGCMENEFGISSERNLCSYLKRDLFH